jgi:plasmid stabilization system protein ParE
MIVRLSKSFQQILLEQVHYIYRDKPKAALKFRKDLIAKLKKDLKYPYHFKKSRYYDDENIRDYVFKGYTTVFKVNLNQKIVFILGILQH